MRQWGDGILYLVVGPVGTGKQAVVAAARQRLANDPRFVFPRRIITNPVNATPEVHQAVTPAQFEDLRRGGSFALVWGSGGRNYALPASIDDDFAAGRAIVAAAATTAVGAAVTKYPRVGIAIVPDAAGNTEDEAGSLFACEEVVRLEGDSAEAAAGELVRRLKAAVRPLRTAVPSASPRPLV